MIPEIGAGVRHMPASSTALAAAVFVVGPSFTPAMIAQHVAPCNRSPPSSSAARHAARRGLRAALNWRICVTSSQPAQVSDRHMVVRYRRNDFIGRSVRYHLRELINTIPECVVGFDVDECEERWGRAVDDRSISSILNFCLEKIHELMTFQPKIFDYGVHTLPDFFASEASRNVHEMSMHDLKNMDKSVYEDLLMDISEARSFLCGARACKFVLELLRCPGVEEHIDRVGGWASVEAIASTFHDLNLHEGSENEHFVQLREVRDLVFMLEDVDRRFESTVEQCEFCIRRLRRKFNIKSNRPYVRNLKAHLAGEKGEYFPVVVVMQ